jgi:hypothetical protein
MVLDSDGPHVPIGGIGDQQLGCSKLSSPEDKAGTERRGQERHTTLLRVALLHAGGVQDICVVKNISSTGLSARVYTNLANGESVQIEFRSGELLDNSIVQSWSGCC